MAAYFKTGPDKISIKPLAFLMPVGIVLMVLLLLLMPLVIILFAFRADLSQITYKNLAPGILMLPLLLACIPLLLLSRRTITFDLINQTISQRTLGRGRSLMRFDEAGEIVLMTSVGLYYRLKSKRDRYGKGYRISPYFNGQDKGKTVFDEELLPAIRAMLKAQPATPAVDYALQDAGMLQWFEAFKDGYRLRPGHSRRQYLPGLIILLLALLYFWFRVFTQAMPSDTEHRFSIILIFPLLLLLATFSKRIYFDPSKRQIVVYRFGIITAHYNRGDFTGFNIVRKTYNGLYNGTDVRLKFRKAGNNKEQELTLETFKKTVPIADFLKEAEWVLNR
ncbi:hypothetical protein [Taibaiella koreensis]|uniref:hypothetical protein n=1 Tax=Taibaiella koreensis TaxID=1268548 RepID=UPI000E59A107|nr:hypothetical protein [Taibaiella koreensis]